MTDPLFERARDRIPGGVNSPVRAFGAVGGDPFFVASAEGAYLVDTEGRRLLDYVQSWGASILGHAHPKVVEAVQRAAADGTSYGAPTAREVELAEAICARVPSVEKVRLVSSGTEAAMTAVRLARGATGRVEDRQVRRLLPRAPRRAPGGGGERGRDPGAARVGGRHRRARSPTPSSSPTTTSAALDAVFATHGADLAAVLVEAGRRQHGARPAEDRASSKACDGAARRTARCSCATR